MIANRIRLTPALRAKLPSQAQRSAPCISVESDEALFLAHLRLSELALLMPLKLLAIALIRRRMATQGITQRLALELAEQREQLNDFSQLSREWIKRTDFIARQQPNLDSLEPLKTMLRQLGVDFERSSSTIRTNP
jgi:hypothetical protein